MTLAVLALAAGVLLACASDADRPAATAESNGTERPSAFEESDEPDPDAIIEVAGRVVATGSDPFVILVIVTDANEQYELVGERADPLWDLQQQQVTVRGRVVREAAGPGFPAQLEVDSHTLDPPRR